MNDDITWIVSDGAEVSEPPYNGLGTLHISVVVVATAASGEDFQSYSCFASALMGDELEVIKNLGTKEQLQLLETEFESPGPSAFKIAQTLYDSSVDDLVRRQAICLASRIQTAEAFEFMSAVVDGEKNSWVRDTAVSLLSYHGKKGFHRLKKIVKNRRSPDCQRDTVADALALSGLRRVSRRSAVQLLIKLLRDPCPEVRWTACFALGVLRAKRAVRHLERLVKEDRGIADYGPLALIAEYSAMTILGTSEVLDPRDLLDEPTACPNWRAKTFTNSYFPKETSVDPSP